MGVAATCAFGAAAAESPAAIAFADGSPLALSTEKNVQAQVVNNTASTWTLSAEAYLIPDNAARVPVAVQLQDTVGPAGTATLVLDPSRDVGEATGFVVVTASQAGETTVARRGLVVAPTTPTPQVEKWSGSNQHFTISGAASGLPDLPLTGPACGSLEEDSHDAGVSSGSDIAVLHYSCVPGDEDRPARLIFDDSDVDKVGQYGGTLKIGDKSVALSYLNGRPMWLAMLMIVVGLALGIWRQLWISSIRPVRRADERVTLIGQDALDRQAEFERNTVGMSYRVYDLVSAVAPEVARLQTGPGSTASGVVDIARLAHCVLVECRRRAGPTRCPDRGGGEARRRRPAVAIACYRLPRTRGRTPKGRAAARHRERSGDARTLRRGAGPGVAGPARWGTDDQGADNRRGPSGSWRKCQRRPRCLSCFRSCCSCRAMSPRCRRPTTSRIKKFSRCASP